MNKKIIILLIGLLLVAVIAVIFLLNLLAPKDTIPDTDIPPAVVPSPTPRENELIITNLLPDGGTTRTYFPFQKITLFFNDNVLPENVFVETNPPTEIEIFQGVSPTEIFIVPSSTWQIGETQISILTTTNSVSGKRLFQPVNYSIITTLPTLSPEEINADHP